MPIRKIALLLSGLPRMWRECLPSQLALFPGDEVDVFFHFWDVIDVTEKEELLALLKPREYRFEPPKDFAMADKNPVFKRDAINVPSRMFSQYYSWAAVGRLFDPWKHDYDLAMRSRADLQFVKPITPLLARVGPQVLWLPWWEENRLLNDMVAIGGPEAVAYYHMLYDQLFDYAQARQCNPEVMLMTHLARRPDIRLIPEHNDYYFVRRAHMAEYTVEQAMRENPGQNKWLDPEIVGAHKAAHAGLSGEVGAQHVDAFQQMQLAQLAAETGHKIPKP